MKILKSFLLMILVFLTLSGIQTHPSQAADMRGVLLIQPDGSKKAMKIDLDQPLSELRKILISKGVDIVPDDKFSSMEMGDLSPRDEAEWTVREFICDSKELCFSQRSSISQTSFESIHVPSLVYDLIKKTYVKDFVYKSGNFQIYKEGIISSTHSQAPQKGKTQSVLKYEETPTLERVLKKVDPSKDGRKRIHDTVQWPHSIYSHIVMKIHGDTYMGSGVIVGPHHLLTCAHCVYDLDKKAFFEEISVYPALNEKIAPFNKIRATTAYIFKSYHQVGDERFDMALLLLDKSIGEYTGWAGLLSAADTDLLKEKVYITGYPADKGSGNQMWSMSHLIKVVKPEVFDYEIDTYAGQSGSPVWINKYGTPLVLGVHTMGRKDVNSGVRLSTKKFEKIFKVIRDTYILDEIDSLDLGNRLVLTPEARPKTAISISLIAQRHESIYRKFLNGELIYRPNKGKDEGMVKLRIRDLGNPLESTFDLSNCGDAMKYFSIATGYRKGKKQKNDNKVEIWIAPRFLIKEEIGTKAKNFKPIMRGWNQNVPVGMFWTYGGWDADESDMDYLVTKSMDDLSENNLYDWWLERDNEGWTADVCCTGNFGRKSPLSARMRKFILYFP